MIKGCLEGLLIVSSESSGWLLEKHKTSSLPGTRTILQFNCKYHLELTIVHYAAISHRIYVTVRLTTEVVIKCLMITDVVCMFEGRMQFG